MSFITQIYIKFQFIINMDINKYISRRTYLNSIALDLLQTNFKLKVFDIRIYF